MRMKIKELKTTGVIYHPKRDGDGSQPKRLRRPPTWHQEYETFTTIDVITDAQSKVELLFAKPYFVDPIIHYIITEDGTNTGLQKFKKRGEEVTNKKLRPIHDLNTFVSLDAS